MAQCPEHGDYLTEQGCPVWGCKRSAAVTGAHLAELRADRDRLASLVEKLRPWRCCPACGFMDGDARNPAHQGCDVCEPLADLLTEMETK